MPTCLTRRQLTQLDRNVRAVYAVSVAVMTQGVAGVCRCQSDDDTHVAIDAGTQTVVVGCRSCRRTWTYGYAVAPDGRVMLDRGPLDDGEGDDGRDGRDGDGGSPAAPVTGRLADLVMS